MRQESATVVSPSRSSGTRPWPEKAISSFSVKRHGRRSASRPLWAKAMRLFQQWGLKRSAASAPASS